MKIAQEKVRFYITTTSGEHCYHWAKNATEAANTHARNCSKRGACAERVTGNWYQAWSPKRKHRVKSLFSVQRQEALA